MIKQVYFIALTHCNKDSLSALEIRRHLPVSITTPLNSLPIILPTPRCYLQCYIEVLSLVIPLQSSTYSCQTLQIYIPKSKTKIHTRPFLLVILMATLSSGGPMATQLRRVGKLKIWPCTRTMSNMIRNTGRFREAYRSSSDFAKNQCGFSLHERIVFILKGTR